MKFRAWKDAQGFTFLVCGDRPEWAIQCEGEIELNIVSPNCRPGEINTPKFIPVERELKINDVNGDIGYIAISLPANAKNIKLTYDYEQ